MITGYLQEVYLDINPEKSYKVITAKQFDSDTRGIIAHITNNGEPYTITGDSVALRVKKPDGHVVIGDATVNQDGTVTALFSLQCLAAHGRAYADLAEMDSSNKVLSTAAFILDIKPSPDGNQANIESMDDYPIIYNFVTNAQDVINSVQEWANGYHGAVPVTQDNPAFNNNSKYWAERSKSVIDSVSFSVNPDTGKLILMYEEP